MKREKLYWQYSADGTVVYVRRAYYGWHDKLKIQTIATYFTSDYTDAVAVAEDFIERTQE